MTDLQAEKILTLQLAIIEAFGDAAQEEQVLVLATRMRILGTFANEADFVKCAREEATRMALRKVNLRAVR